MTHVCQELALRFIGGIGTGNRVLQARDEHGYVGGYHYHGDDYPVTRRFLFNPEFTERHDGTETDQVHRHRGIQIFLAVAETLAEGSKQITAEKRGAEKPRVKHHVADVKIVQEHAGHAAQGKDPGIGADPEQDHQV